MNQHSALTGYGTRRTPQSAPIPGSDQVPNSAGGFTWAVDRWQRLHRFLVLGTTGGTYYINQAELTRENADSVMECIREDGRRTVAVIVEVSQAGRAPKNEPALFALAMCAKLGDEDTRRAAYEALPDVARIATHLFQFLTYVQQFGGWGRMTSWAVANWHQRDPEQVAYQAVKYRQRYGWTHRDVLRKSHAKPPTQAHDLLYGWITGKVSGVGGALRAEAMDEGMLALIAGYEQLQASESPERTAEILHEYSNLPREAVKTEHLSAPIVWDELLTRMPMTAMIRNLANMTRIGLLTPTSEATLSVLDALDNEDALHRARVHPISVLAAMVTYAQGHGMRGGGEWSPVPQIVDALDGAFYKAFGNVEPTGKRTLLALDVSSSMDVNYCQGIPALTARMASAALALVTANVEQQYECVAFTAAGRSYGWGREPELTPFPLSSRQRLDDVARAASELPFGGTDCALPMLYALNEGREVDTFVIFTDNETWAGTPHPSQALIEYRKQSGIDARLAVVGMASNEFSIADPNDAGMLDLVGMDTATPNMIADFASGRL